MSSFLTFVFVWLKKCIVFQRFENRSWRSDMKNRAVFALPALLMAGHLLTAQQIKKVPPAPTLPGDGKAMFVSYCAACHGADGKGNGPAAAALTRKPADLTMLASRNGGVFPSGNVYRFINGDEEIAAQI